MNGIELKWIELNWIELKLNLKMEKINHWVIFSKMQKKKKRKAGKKHIGENGMREKKIKKLYKKRKLINCHHWIEFHWVEFSESELNWIELNWIEWNWNWTWNGNKYKTLQKTKAHELWWQL